MEISVFECQKLLEQGHVKLLDIREDWERKLCSISNSEHIPLGVLDTAPEELFQDKMIVVYCHHGQRSRRAVLWLKDQGIDNVVNLIGGIDAWSIQIDHNVPRY